MGKIDYANMLIIIIYTIYCGCVIDIYLINDFTIFSRTSFGYTTLLPTAFLSSHCRFASILIGINSLI